MVLYFEGIVIGPECFTFPFELRFSSQRQLVFDENAIEGITGMFHNYCNIRDITRISVLAESFY